MSERMAYVARIKDCGCVVAASVDDPDHAADTGRFVAQEIREGFTVEHMTVEAARALPWGWPCEHMKAASDEQLTLAASSAAAGGTTG